MQHFLHSTLGSISNCFLLNDPFLEKGFPVPFYELQKMKRLGNSVDYTIRNKLTFFLFRIFLAGESKDENEKCMQSFYV